MSNKSKQAIIITTKHYSCLDKKWKPKNKLLIDSAYLIYDGKKEDTEEHYLKHQNFGQFDVYIAPCTGGRKKPNEDETSLAITRGDYLEELINAVLKEEHELDKVFLFSHDKDFFPNESGGVDGLAQEKDIPGGADRHSVLTRLVKYGHVWLFYHELESRAGKIVLAFKNGWEFGEKQCRNLKNVIVDRGEMIDFFSSVNHDDRYAKSNGGGEFYE